MDNLFLNRMNSRQGIVKKEQEPIFKKQQVICIVLNSFNDKISA